MNDQQIDPKLALNVIINNHVYDFSTENTVFQACLIWKIFLPRFCYHVALKIAGNCRMCLVEEKSSLKPIASCAVSVAGGQIIHTDTEIVKKAREGVIEYLLINHPLDCPICDQGGECDLQDQTMVFGADRGRFYESKRTTPNKNLGFLIKTFLNRCIHCSRCTRFLSDLAGTDDIQLLGRGLKTEISNYVDEFLKSEISGNIIDLCPVGALTSKPYAFQARIWELDFFYTFDITDGFGANIQIDFRGTDIMRILPKSNNYLNEEWISDRGRFVYESFNIQRLTAVFFKKNNSKIYLQMNWVNFFNSFKNWFFLMNRRNYFLQEFVIEQGNFNSVDSVFSLKYFQLFSFFLYRSNLFDLKLKKNFDFRKFYGILDLDFLDFNHKKAEDRDLFLLNVNLRFESPILNLKVRRMWTTHETDIFTFGFLSNYNFDYIHLGRSSFKSFFNKTLDNLCFGFSGEHYPQILHNVYPISLTFSNIATGELNVILSNYSFYNDLNLSLGFSELKKIISNYFFDIKILHHMEEGSLFETISFNNFYTPTSFFYEKISTYLNNTFNFFNTSQHFSLKISGTKEDYKIVLAMYEMITRKLTRLSFKKLFNTFFLPFSINKIIDSNFMEIVYRKQYVFQLILKSIYNNFYNTNILCRLSSVLALCSNILLINSDFVYVSIK